MIDVPPQARRYALTPGLLLKSWDQGSGVAYAPDSASTHLVSADAVAVMLETATSADGMSLAALAAALDDVGADPGAAWLDRLHDLLDGLVHAGLLRRTD